MMRRRSLLVWLTGAWVVTACAGDPVAQDIRPSTTLEGEWLVTAIDDEPVGGTTGAAGPGLTFRAGAEVVRWEPGCAQLMFLYRIDGEDFRADAIRYDIPFDDPIHPPEKFMPPPCAIGWPPGLKEAMEAMSLAHTVAFTGDGNVRIHGDGRSVAASLR